MGVGLDTHLTQDYMNLRQLDKSYFMRKQLCLKNKQKNICRKIRVRKEFSDWLEYIYTWRALFWTKKSVVQIFEYASIISDYFLLFLIKFNPKVTPSSYRVGLGELPYY